MSSEKSNYEFGRKLNMLIFFSVISCFSLLSFLFFIGVTFKKNPEILGKWKYILIITSYLITTTSSVYYVMMKHVKTETDYRPFITILTIIIAFISFTTSVFLSNRTTEMNKENQKKSFVMELIKNNSLILKEKEIAIDRLIKQLDSKLNSSGYSLDQLVPLATSHFWYHKNIFQPSIDQINSQGSFKKEKAVLEKAFNQDEDSVLRVLVTYFLLHPSGKDAYEQFDSSITNRKFSVHFQKILANEKNLLENIDLFIQSSKIQQVLKTDIKSLPYEEIKPFLEELFSENYKDLGHFFRNSYRVVKTINSFSEGDEDFKRTFLGILRSYYSENVLVAIYYNSIFTDKGLGYAKELALSDFFGDKRDLDNDQPIHFRQQSLYFNEKDLKVLKKIFISESPISQELQNKEANFSKIIKDTFNKA